MNKINNHQVAAVLFAVCAFIPMNAQASLLASDNFSASYGTNLAIITDTESSGVGTYSVIQGTNLTPLSVTNIAGFGTGNVLRWPGGGETYYRMFNGSTNFTLNSLATGETLRLAFDVRFAGFLTSADNFSFGFVSTASPNSVVYANLDLNSGGGYVSEFRYRTGSFNLSDLGVQINSSFTEPATVTGTGYAMKMEVTRQTNGFRLDYYRDSALTGSTTMTNGTTAANAVVNLTMVGIAFRGIPLLTTYIDNLLIERALPLPTPSISGVTPSQTNVYGTSSVTLTGLVSAAGPVYPVDGEVVTVTIDGVSSNATIAGGEGGFSVEYPTASLDDLGSPYTITYAYAGGVNLNAAADDTSTSLTVLPSGPEPTASTNTSVVLSSGQIQIGFAMASGAVYRVQANTNLLDGADWSDITDSLTNEVGETLTFTDTNSTAFPARNYRVASP